MDLVYQLLSKLLIFIMVMWEYLEVQGKVQPFLLNCHLGVNKESDGKSEVYLHSDSSDKFIFDAPLEDLAKQEDVLTAKYGAKRLEYRASLTLEGNYFHLKLSVFRSCLVSLHCCWLSILMDDLLQNNHFSFEQTGYMTMSVSR